MNTGRRGFLQAILAAGVAPYVQTAAGVLMPVRALAVPELYGRSPLMDMIALLESSNDILKEMNWVAAARSFNTTIRTGLPDAAWRHLLTDPQRSPQ